MRSAMLRYISKARLRRAVKKKNQFACRAKDAARCSNAANLFCEERERGKGKGSATERVRAKRFRQIDVARVALRVRAALKGTVNRNLRHERGGSL